MRCFPHGAGLSRTLPLEGRCVLRKMRRLAGKARLFKGLSASPDTGQQGGAHAAFSSWESSRSAP